jgi:hypothetical protein
LRPRITPGVLLSGGQWVDPITVKFDGTSNLRSAGWAVNDPRIYMSKRLLLNDLACHADQLFDIQFVAYQYYMSSIRNSK